MMAKFSKAGLVALAAGAAVTLTACGPTYDTYIEGYWDNGDPFLAPAKSALFDEDGVPTCDFPIKYNSFESRATPQGLIRSVLFELNHEPVDPTELRESDYPTTEQYNNAVRRAERLQETTSAEILFQYTHPVFFDAEFGIEGPEDIQDEMDAIRDHLEYLGDYPDMQRADYYSISSEFIATDQGEFQVRRLVDPQGYLDEVGFEEPFNGLRYNYQVASSGDIEYLLVRDKEEATVRLFDGNEEQSLSGVLFFTTIDITYPYLSPTALEADRAAYEAEDNSAPYVVEFPDGPRAQILLTSDGCGKVGNTEYARYYVADYELFTPGQAGSDDPWADVDGLGEATEELAEDSE